MTVRVIGVIQVSITFHYYYYYYLCQEGHVIASDCPCVCLFVYEHDYAKSSRAIVPKLCRIMVYYSGKENIKFSG